MDLGEFYPCLNVKNLVASIDFYRKLGFEMTSDHSDENWAVMQHGSVVAREYGIPAVVGVLDATKVLQTGQKIRVNGDSGFAEILNGG